MHIAINITVMMIMTNVDIHIETSESIFQIPYIGGSWKGVGEIDECSITSELRSSDVQTSLYPRSDSKEAECRKLPKFPFL